MSFFLDADVEESAVIGEASRDTSFNFFGTSKEDNDNSNIFDTIFNQADKDKDDNHMESSIFFSKSPEATKSKLAENATKSSSTSRSAVSVESKKPSTPSVQQARHDGEAQNSTQAQLKTKSFSANCKTSKRSFTENLMEDRMSEKKRAPEMLPRNNASTPQAKGLPLRSQYKHHMQLINEQSPSTPSFQLPFMKEQSNPAEELTKPTAPPQKSAKSYCEKLTARHSLSVTSVRQAPAANSVTTENASHSSTSTDTKELADALQSFEYEPLKEQLGNLPAAKQTGKFTHQVAVSVEALFKCHERQKNKRLTTLHGLQSETADKIGKMQELLNSELQSINAYHQAIVDHKLSQLSSVLDDIKTAQEELGKYRKLLRSLTADLNAEQ